MAKGKVLVTGCAGFIGSHLCHELLAKGYDVIGIDNLNPYYPVRFKKQNLDILRPAGLKFIKADITEPNKLERIFLREKPSKVVHLAARAGVRPSLEKPLLYHTVNVIGTANLLEMCRTHNVQQFIFGSSSSVYGKNKKVPFSEEDDVNKQVSPYAASKKASETICRSYAVTFGIKTTCLRFFTVYGPRGRPDMAPYLFTQAILKGEKIRVFGDGKSSRDYTYIKDIVFGIIAALENEYDFEIINLGNSQPIMLEDFISEIEKATGKKAKKEYVDMPKGDVPKTFADITKAKKLLGYEPKTDIRKGIGEFVKWFKENRL